MAYTKIIIDDIEYELKVIPKTIPMPEKDYEKRTPLFTTEDGKEIFESDVYWYVREEGAHTSEWEIVTHSGHKPTKCKAAFATIEAAKEYVLMNKPLFCVKDVFQFLHISFLRRQDNEDVFEHWYDRDGLIELAKQKINNP